MYVEKKKIGNNVYNYLKISVRVGNKTKSKTIAYLGKAPLSKKEIKEKIAAISVQKIKTIKKAVKEELKQSLKNINLKFLSKNNFKKLEEIKKDFIKKIKTLDKQLLNDMFKDFKTYYIFNTNAIEGNTLTLNQTNLLLNENLTPEGKDLREIYDHINEKETFDYLLEKKPEITNRSIIDIHSRLLNKIDKRVGDYRKHDARVFGASFKTRPAKFVHTDMNILLKWYKKNKKRLHPLILAAVFHEKFERIHPFYDGNGRTGRMLINLILSRNNLPPLIVRNGDKKEYFRVLSKGHKADLTKIQPEFYKDIVKFCYNQLLDTYKRIFSKWG